MAEAQFCARWECTKPATFDKPLCHDHWLEWDAGELEECNRCRRFYDQFEFVLYYEAGWDEELPPCCNVCLDVIATGRGLGSSWLGKAPLERTVLFHADIQRTLRYVYILKLSDNHYYVGQTTDLQVRLLEHRDGKQWQTREKDPKLVYFEEAFGGKLDTNARERELIALTKDRAGERKLRVMIEAFRAPLRLLDLEA